MLRPGEDPLVALLLEDLAKHHPGCSVSVVQVPHPNDPGAALRPLATHSTAHIGIADDDAALAWLSLPREDHIAALGPLVAARVAVEHGDAVTFIAPDATILAPLPDPEPGVGVALRMMGLPKDNRTPTADDLCRMTALDPGFMTVSADAAKGLASAGERLWRPSVPSRGDVGTFWSSLPACVDTAFINDPSIGIAYWNLWERPEILTGTDTTTRRCMRLPQFDPDKPYLLSTGQGPQPRVLVSESEWLRTLLEERAQRLVASEYADTRSAEFLGGVRVDGAVHACVSTALAGDRRESEAEIRAVVNGVGPSFRDWLTETAPSSRNQLVSRYLMGLWSSSDHLPLVFPNPGDDHAEQFLEWVRGPACDIPVPLAFMPPLVGDLDFVPESESEFTPGVNVIGFLHAGFGVGEATRLFLAALDESPIAHAAISLEHDDIDNSVDVRSIPGAGPRHDTNLVCVNVDWLHLVDRRLGPGFLASRYSIGTWWWESNILPEHLARQLPRFDELWVGSTFIADALREYTDSPIRVFPLPIRVPDEAPRQSRDELDLPDGFMFLFVFDFNSTVARKNPEGVIRAFMDAFSPDSGPVLVIKSINGDRHTADLERLRALTARRADIQVIDGFVSAERRDALMLTCDCYVSLHRCEGFGLTMAEAMAAGKPVIATGYSANLDFMDDAVARLVGYQPWELNERTGPYPAGTQWAEPDRRDAVKHMQEVVLNPAEASAMGVRARHHIQRTRGSEALAEFVRTRLDEIVREEEMSDEGVDQRLPGPLEDARKYDRERHSNTGSLGARFAGRVVRPYSAPTDALLERLMASDEWIFGDERRSAEELRNRLDNLERAIDNLERATSRNSDALHRLERALRELSDSMDGDPRGADIA